MTNILQILRDEPLFFQSFSEMFPDKSINILRIACLLYLHDVADPDNTLSEEMIIKVAAASNYNNPGSAAFTTEDQVYLARYVYFDMTYKSVRPLYM